MNVMLKVDMNTSLHSTTRMKLTSQNCSDYAKQIMSNMCDEFEAKQLIKFHVDDNHNVQDEQGRIFVGGNRVATELEKYLKPHQIGGIRFMFENLIADSGCILAHEMGLGKSVQVVTLCDLLLKYTQNVRILCVVPINTLYNWKSEFNMWLPCYIQMSKSKFRVHIVSEKLKTKVERLNVVSGWQGQGGILLIGYEMFRSITSDCLDDQNDSLLKADVVICDEGHRLKNETSATYITLNQVNTRRRIILTGYPLQNNLTEYFTMVNFVRPNYLKSVEEFTMMFVETIQKAHFENINGEEEAIMYERVFVLNTILRPIVQRRANILKNTLPPKLDYVIPVGITSRQRKMLQTYYDERFVDQKNILTAYATCTNICNHPDIVFQNIGNTSNSWIGLSMEGYEAKKLEQSTKFKVLMSIIKETMKVHDRLLIFSQSVATLDLVEYFLRDDDKHWKKGDNYYRLDGSTESKERLVLVDAFNRDEKVKLFLISTKAGGMGINLVGANRLVLIDANWNPCHDNQAISRIYRYKQSKTCYIYRLISEYSLERFIYDKQVRKEVMAARLIDSVNPTCVKVVKEKLVEWLSQSEMPFEQKHERNYDDVVLNEVIGACGKDIVKKPFHHEDFLQDIDQRRLSADEKKVAFENYINDVSEFKSKSKQKRKQKVSIDTNEPTHSWIGVDKWKKKGFAAKIVTSSKDIGITANSKTISIRKGQRIVLIQHLGKTFIETDEGVVKVNDQLQTELTTG